MAEDSDLFWSYNEPICPSLSSFAMHLLNTLANSVPSERVWSNMNYIHSKTRNSLSPSTVDKLLFIYNNSRALKHLKINSLMDIEELAWGE